MKTIENKIALAYLKWTGTDVDKMTALPVSGSARKYFRIIHGNQSLLAVYNESIKENDAFVGFTEHFLAIGLNVPEVYHYLKEEKIYFLRDLGDKTLFDFLAETRKNGGSESVIADVYKNAISHLIRFQLEGGNGLDFELCYPRKSFDRQSILWDLSYFKYYFIKLAGIDFNEQELENDFGRFTDLLMEADRDYFLFRDFQSRNIMVSDAGLYFIDYQGGRKGALPYDLASLLFDSKADLSNELKIELLNDYLTKITANNRIDKSAFLKYYYPYVYVRLLQAMGAYGYRGYYERKQHFLASIPYAVENLRYLLENHEPDIHIPELIRVLKEITNSPRLSAFQKEIPNELLVTVNSFSFKNAIPEDQYGHGGGFVFDCRFLPNPGRDEKYRKSTGLDKEVINYLESYSEVNDFLENVSQIVRQAVSNYKERNFTNLMISFGCTGGQHRSVYFASKIAEFIAAGFDVKVELNHRELNLHK